jgi:reactive intermediate/imine deaminase
MQKYAVETQNAPEAIGAYSQAIRAGDTVYISGQIPLDPETMTLVEGTAEQQIEQVIKNLSAVAMAAGGSLDQIVRLTVYLVDMSDFPIVNDVMARNFSRPYPARAAIGVAALPKDALVEMDAVLVVA